MSCDHELARALSNNEFFPLSHKDSLDFGSGNKIHCSPPEESISVNVMHKHTWVAAALVNATFAVVVTAFNESPVPKII